MPSEILMPALSPTMEEGTLARWLVKEGDRVEAGQVIAEIETDKATMEFEAADDGEISRLLVPAGTEGVKVNSPIATLLAEGETAEASPAAAPPVSTPQVARPTPEPAKAIPTAATARTPDPQATGPMRTQTVREALRDAMAEEMRRDSDVFLIGEEVGEYQGAYKVSQGLLDEFSPKRVIDTPITEHGFTGLAVGAAFAGLRPIVEFMTFNFALQAIDQIINSAAKTLYMSGGQMHCPIVFRGPNGAAARVAAQHSHDFAALYAQVPGLKVVQPYTAADAKGLLKSAIRDPNPVIFLENEILYGRSFEVPEGDDVTVPIGVARVARAGNDVTIISFGMGMTIALEAADALQKDGLSAEVIDLRTLRPIDYDTVLASVKKTNRAVTVEGGFSVGSIGNHLSAILMERAFDDLDAPVINCTGKDVPMPYAANLEKLALVSTAEVVQACRAVAYR
ncbi:pyruvate dehydrogenase E1 component beta subunit [Amaricoccus macauensis]|uniref:Pyruvate dehydrogenase E1 component subunit beta n=1 Tax=Amaricoccus macauensis TaxID=57001 RepID=A0A840SWL6_9RHOB|nr:pyruvate dehydrogenase complex E1 component subunit beta [Amaricoccus macauensis]MBB5223502.1 pyruvate dehydrogenase E1 component beta subunit [Amaricoccus macauensis]